MNDSVETNEITTPTGDFMWYVIHTRPRCEKKTADYCRFSRYQYYLPLLIRKHRYGARSRSYKVPLFAGYVFVLLDQAGKSVMRSSDHVANVLAVHDQQTLITQLNQIRRALETNAAVELLPQFKAGMKVEVKDGPLKGVEGFVDRVKSGTRIILNVDFIKQSIAVEVDAEWLIPR